MKSWFVADPDRHESERRFWTRNGFTEERSAKRVAYNGTVDVLAGRGGEGSKHGTFRVRVRYPDAFPYRPPDVEFIEPRIRGSRHQSPAGEPCLFPPRDWTPEMPPSQVHNALRRWLGAQLTGSFRRELALYELPEYFTPSAMSVLIPEQALAVFGESRGRFSLTCAEGRDLAVLKSVDGQQVADDLLEGLRLGSEVKQATRTGSWYRVGKEPPFVRATDELAKFLKSQGHGFAAGRKPTKEGLVGLVFRDSVLDEERLLILDYSASGNKVAPKFNGWPLRCPWAYVISEEQLFLRLRGIREPDALSESNVLVLGCGAIGSALALDLAREGVGRFGLFDPDRLRPGNVMRHALDLYSVGQHKAAALELALGRVNPYAETRSEGDNLFDPDVLENAMRADQPLHAPDLIVSAIGEDAVEGLISAIAARADAAPVLFVRTLHDGDLIRIMLQRPGSDDPCIECMRLYARDEHPDFIDAPPSDVEPVFDAGCATGAQPGAGLTSRHAALFGAKRVLGQLLATEPSPVNHWLWVEHAITDAPDARLHVAETMHAFAFERHGECRVCA